MSEFAECFGKMLWVSKSVTVLQMVFRTLSPRLDVTRSIMHCPAHWSDIEPLTMSRFNFLGSTAFSFDRLGTSLSVESSFRPPILFRRSSLSTAGESSLTPPMRIFRLYGGSAQGQERGTGCLVTAEWGDSRSSTRTCLVAESSLDLRSEANPSITTRCRYASLAIQIWFLPFQFHVFYMRQIAICPPEPYPQSLVTAKTGDLVKRLLFVCMWVCVDWTDQLSYSVLWKLSTW